MNNFCRSLDLHLINCKIELDLTWSKDWMISEISRIAAVAANPPDPVRAAVETTRTTFQTNSTKLYAHVASLSINDNIKVLENLKQGFKRTVSWDKYRYEITKQLRNKNLDYMIDPTFTNINRLLVFSFKIVTMILKEIHLIGITYH